MIHHYDHSWAWFGRQCEHHQTYTPKQVATEAVKLDADTAALQAQGYDTMVVWTDTGPVVQQVS
jgi:hypothetical protein